MNITRKNIRKFLMYCSRSKLKAVFHESMLTYDEKLAIVMKRKKCSGVQIASRLHLDYSNISRYFRHIYDKIANCCTNK